MLVIVSYIIRSLAPVINPMGVFGFFLYITYAFDSSLYSEQLLDTLGKISYVDGWLLFVVSTFVFVIGIIFGLKSYKNDIPLRWSWSKSKNELFGFSISTILGYGLYFVAYPYAFLFIHFIVMIVI